MLPPEEVKRILLRGWLAKAEEDFGAAQHLLSGGDRFLGAVGFHCQQSAEKFLKAYLVWRQTDFPKTHDITELLDILAGVDAQFSQSLRESTVLTKYAVETRYPANLPELTPDVARELIRIAGDVRSAILGALGEAPQPRE